MRANPGVARFPARVGRRRGPRDDGARRRGKARRHARARPVSSSRSSCWSPRRRSICARLPSDDARRRYARRVRVRCARSSPMLDERPAARPRRRRYRRARRQAGALQRATGMTWFLRNWDQVAVALWPARRRSRSRRSSIAFAIALPVGIVAARNDARLCRWSIGVAGFLYTIPTLAFLALLIPLVGLGRTNAIIAMVAFSLVDPDPQRRDRHPRRPPDVVDAARGMGMSARADAAAHRAAACVPGDRRRTARRGRHRDQRRRRRGLRERGRARHARSSTASPTITRRRSGPAR